jgi:hypothetical protein
MRRILAADLGLDGQIVALKMEGGVVWLERARFRPHRFIQRIAQFVFDHGDHAADGLGIDGAALQLGQFGQRAPVAHQRQARPVAEIGEVPVGDLQNLVERNDRCPPCPASAGPACP